MYTTRNNFKSIINLDFASIIMLSISLLLLMTVALEGSLAPIALYILMIILGVVMIVFFSNKNEISLKVKLFILFFSLYLIYTLLHHYFLISLFPHHLPYVYPDEPRLYLYSKFGIPYVSGKKNILNFLADIYRNPNMFKLHQLPLHVLFTAAIDYLSIIIDGNTSIVMQKIFPPFLGGMFSVVLYSVIKHQFKDAVFGVNATIIYGLLSAVFMYSTVLLRDIDVALMYMVAIYLFLQKNSLKNFIFLILIAFATYYLRAESGLVVFGFSLLYIFLIVKKIKNTPMKILSYILLSIALLILMFIYFISKMKLDVEILEEARGASQNITKESFSAIFEKLPFGLKQIVKTLFGQIQTFPILNAIQNPPLILSSIFWPFIDIMMVYAVMNKYVRSLRDEKIKYLLPMAIVVLLLMSAEPLARRMMSVYPIIYLSALYVFASIEKYKIKKVFYVYLYGIISLNTLYYLLKI